jgi:hypothetical protein
MSRREMRWDWSGKGMDAGCEENEELDAESEMG